MATSCTSEGPAAAAAVTTFPWRRGAESTPSKPLCVEAAEFVPANKLLSVEAPEFIPRWKEQQPAACGTPAYDGNCYMISLGAYSDDSDDDDDIVSQTPTSKAGDSATNNASSGESTSFRFRRPWRVAAAEFVPQEVAETKTASSSKDTSSDTKRKSTDEERPWKNAGVGTSHSSSGGGEKPWKNAGKSSISKDGQATVSVGASSKQTAAPWKKKASAVTMPIDSGSPISVSTLSTSASSNGFDSTSAASSTPNRSRSSTPPPSREQEPTLLNAHDLIRWRHVSVCERPAEIYTSAANVESSEVAPEGVSQEADTSKTVEVASSKVPTPPVSSTPARPMREAKIEPSSTKEEKCWRNVDPVSKLKVSEDSWTAKQRARRASSIDSESMSDEEVVRAMKSILNKLTIEKFDSLSKQLIHCGICTSVHLELLIQEVFEKATTQHHFLDMYADLCALLNAHFLEHPLVDDPKMNFKKILLTCCQTSFEKHLVPPVGLEKLSSEDRTIAEQLYKTRMLGNIRFVGSLLVRKMLASKVMLAIMEELLQDPTPEALESLAALLTVVGPSFDHPDWAYRTTLNAIFAQVEKLCKKTSVSQRVRCLLKDVIDIRKSGWQDRRPKKIEGPKKLDEVASEAGMSNKSGDASNDWAVVGGSRLAKIAAILPSSKPAVPTSTPVSAGKQQMISSQKSEKTVKGTTSGHAMLQFLKNRDQQESKSEVKKETVPFDVDACKAEVLATLSELRVSHDVSDAVARIAEIAVPLSQQSIEFGEILCRLVDDGAQESRKVGFQLLAGLFSEGHWKPEALEKGLDTFVKESCPELQCDVPLLPRIVREELYPAFTPLVKAKMLGADQHEAMINF